MTVKSDSASASVAVEIDGNVPAGMIVVPARGSREITDLAGGRSDPAPGVPSFKYVIVTIARQGVSS